MPILYIPRCIKSVGPVNIELSVKHVNWLNFIWRKLGATENVVSVYFDKPRTICSADPPLLCFFSTPLSRVLATFYKYEYYNTCFILYFALKSQFFLLLTSPIHISIYNYCHPKWDNKQMFILEIAKDENLFNYNTYYKPICMPYYLIK